MHLYELGVATTEKWLEEHYDHIERETTLDLVKTYI